MPQLPFKWPPVTQIAVVLCIIVFMAAILFPVFQKVPHSPRDYCQSNLKQLALAYVQYEQDANENFSPRVNAAGNGWAGQIYSFTKSTGVYQCTKDRHDGTFISYAENQNLVRQNMNKFVDPAETVELYEFSTLRCDPSMPEAVSATGLSAPQDSTRHDPATFGLNFLLTDGHVQRLLPAQVSNGPGAVSPSTLPSGRIIRTFAVK